MISYLALAVVALVGAYLYVVAMFNYRDLWRVMAYHRDRCRTGVYLVHRLRRRNRELRALLAAGGLAHAIPDDQSDLEAGDVTTRRAVRRPPSGRRAVRYLRTRLRGYF